MLKKFFGKLRRDERGVSALEYAILAAVIVGIVVVALGSTDKGLGKSFTDLFGKVDKSVQEITGTGSGSGATPQ